MKNHNFIGWLSVIAVCGCSHRPPPPAYKPAGVSVFVSPDGLGDVESTCLGKVRGLEPARSIADSLGVGLARAGFRSIAAPADGALFIGPTIHVRSCRDGNPEEAAGDLILYVGRNGHVVDHIVYESGMQPPSAWVTDVVAHVLASRAIAADLRDDP